MISTQLNLYWCENLIHQLSSLVLHGGDEVSIGIQQDGD